MTTVEPQKKNRLSRLLGGSKREKSPPPTTTAEGAPSFPHDSAYASSDVATPAPDVSNEQIVPAEKDSDIANIDKKKNLGLKPSTGQVFDRDTGEVVTVVTTTTTTTTTTTRKPGKKNPEVRKDVQETTQTQPANSTNAITNESSNTVDPNSDKSGIIAEMPATPAEQARPTYPVSGDSNIRNKSPGVPPRSLNRRSGEFGTHSTVNTTNTGGVNSSYNPAPDISPEGSYMARPGPTGNTPPLSPVTATTAHNNYSYPSRAGGRDSLDGVSTVSTTNQPQTRGRTTMADLKAAAKGLHGVGETLRGTLNSAVDENFQRKNTNKQAYATAKNDAVLARGRDEISGIPHRNRTPPGGHQQQHNNESTYNDHSYSQPGLSGGAGGHTYTSSAAPPPIPANQPPVGGYNDHGSNNTSGVGGAPASMPVKPPSPHRTPMTQQAVPGYWSADDGYGADQQGGYGAVHGGQQQQEELTKERSKTGIGKLFKRKPVQPGGGGGGGEGQALKDRKYY